MFDEISQLAARSKTVRLHWNAVSGYLSIYH